MLKIPTWGTSRRSDGKEISRPTSFVFLKARYCTLSWATWIQVLCEIATTMAMNITVLWNVKPCNFMPFYQIVWFRLPEHYLSMNQVHNLTPYFLNHHFNITLLLTPTSAFVDIFHILHACYTPHQSSLCFDIPNCVWWDVKVMKLLIMHFFFSFQLLSLSYHHLIILHYIVLLIC